MSPGFLQCTRKTYLTSCKIQHFAKTFLYVGDFSRNPVAALGKKKCNCNRRAESPGLGADAQGLATGLPDLQRPPGTPWLSHQGQRLPQRAHCEALTTGRNWPMAGQQAAPRRRGPCQASLTEMRRPTLPTVSSLALFPLKLRSVKRTQAENKKAFKDEFLKDGLILMTRKEGNGMIGWIL